MDNKECIIKFLVLKTITHSDRKIHSRISKEYKQEVVDFLKCYSDLYFKKNGYIDWEYYLISDERSNEDIRGIVRSGNKESDEIITDLQLMVYKVDHLFSYLEENHIPFNIKGVEYYLRLYLLNGDIDKNNEVRQAVLTLDVNRLKVLLNSFSGSSSFLSNDTENEEITLFRNELTKIYLEMKTFLKNK